MRPRARLALLAVAAWLALASPPAGAAAQGLATQDLAAQAELRNPSAVHAIVVGVDRYAGLPPLRGAVADARDIEASLRRLGVTDVAALYDEAADRDSVLKRVFDLSARVGRGDLVILSIAGHGALEPELVKGSEPDGKDAVFLLSGFSPSGPGTRQRIIDKEFNHLIKIFESRGARVVFVADSCFGGGLARSVDPRGGDVVYRSVPAYAVTDDELKPVSSAADAYASEVDFTRSIFLAAVDKSSRAPEIRSPDGEGFRGALSYAFARALEGAADANGDGVVTVDELFSYVRQAAYQLSDQRQTIVSASPPTLKAASEPVVELSRGVTILGPPGPARVAPTQDRVASAQDRVVTAEATPGAPALSAQRPVRLAALDGLPEALDGIAPREARFEVVTPRQSPELVWDRKTGDVIAAGDVVAREIAREDLPGVVDRTAAVRALKAMSARALQDVALSPDSRTHRAGAVVEAVVGDLSGRSLVLFDVAGDGALTLLYPREAGEAQAVDKAQFRLPIRVRAPFGADQLVAVTGDAPMQALAETLRRLDGRRAPAQALRAIAQNMRPDMRIGSIGVFTAP